MLKKIAENLILLYIFLIPIMWVPELPVLGQKLQYSEIIFLLLLTVFFINLHKKNVSFINNKNFIVSYTILLTLVFLILITVIRSPNKLKSLIEFCGISYLFLAYFVFTQIITDKILWWRIIKIWCITAFIVLLVGFFEYFNFKLMNSSKMSATGYHFLNNLSPFFVYRMQSTFRHPNMFASYLHISLIIFSIMLIKKDDRPIKFPVIVTLTILIIASFLAKSRIFAGILLSLYLIISRFKNKLFFIPKLSILIFTVFFLFLSISSIIWYIFPIKFSFENQKLPKIELNMEYFPYYFYQKASINMIKRFPFLGVGIGMYNQNLVNYINLEKLKHSFHMLFPDYKIGEDSHSLQVKKTGMDSHSTYLGWAAEIGLIGMGLVLLFLFNVIIKLIRMYKKAFNEKKFIIWIFISGFIGFLINGFYLDILTLRHFWFLLIIISSFINIFDEENKLKCAEFVDS